MSIDKLVEALKHLPGQHNQLDHGRRGGTTRGKLADTLADEIKAGRARPGLLQLNLTTMENAIAQGKAALSKGTGSAEARQRLQRSIDRTQRDAKIIRTALEKSGHLQSTKPSLRKQSSRGVVRKGDTLHVNKDPSDYSADVIVSHQALPGGGDKVTAMFADTPKPGLRRAIGDVTRGPTQRKLDDTTYEYINPDVTMSKDRVEEWGKQVASKLQKAGVSAMIKL